MKVLALDPAKLTGFCHSDGTRGVWDLGEEKYRLLRLLDAITDTHKAHPFDILAAENAQQGSHNFIVQGIHAEYRGIIRLAAGMLGAEFVLINPKSAKKWATGSGNAKKSDMIRHAELQHRIRIASEDEADAFWFCKYVEAGQHLNTKAVQRKQEKSRRKKEARLF